MIPTLLLAAFCGAVPAGVPFEEWFTERGVEVRIARSPGSIPWVRGSSELEASAASVHAVITDFASYPELMTPVVTRAAVLEAGEGTARLHMVWDYPFPFRDRDAIVRYGSEKIDGGGLCLTWRDETRPGDPSQGVRIQKVAGETLVEPLGPDRCRVTYTYLGDLGGSLPRWAEEKAWRHEPLGYFYALRRALKLPIPPK